MATVGEISSWLSPGRSVIVANLAAVAGVIAQARVEG
jgi:hypothetical protein